MNTNEGKDASGASRLHAWLAAGLMWFVRRVIDPSILRCYGWKYERRVCMGRTFECWIDPADGGRCTQEIALRICKSRIEGS